MNNTNKTKQDINTISEKILISKDPELNYYAAINLGINKIKHLTIVIESKDALLNYKCAKHCLKTNSMIPEDKKTMTALHIEIVLNSGNYKLINELTRFLKYSIIDDKYIPIGRNCGRQKKQNVRK